MTLKRRTTPTCQASCMDWISEPRCICGGVIQESEVAVDAEVEVGADSPLVHNTDGSSTPRAGHVTW